MREDIPSIISFGKKREVFLTSLFYLIRELGFKEFAVQTRDVRYGNTLRTLHLAGTGVGAVSESEFVHLGDHGLDPFLSLGTTLGKKGEGTDPGCNEQHCRTVLTGGHTGAATYAGGSIHALLGPVMRDEDIVGILGGSCAHGDESTCLKDLIECASVDHEVLDDRESSASPRLYGNGSSVFEMAHEELASGNMVVRTVCTAVDIKRTSSANAFAAVMVEGDRTAALASAFHCDGVTPLADELLVKDIKHLEE